MKMVIATLLTSSALVSADSMPHVQYDECTIVSSNIMETDTNPVNPDPEVTGSPMLIVYCGHESISDSGTSTNKGELKWIVLDEEQAQIIVEAATDIVEDDGGIYIEE